MVSTIGQISSKSICHVTPSMMNSDGRRPCSRKARWTNSRAKARYDGTGDRWPPWHLLRIYNNAVPAIWNLYPSPPRLRGEVEIAMNPQLSTIASVLASAAVAVWTALVNSWRIVVADQAGTYRPEAYYMRGPGPKWREKHAQAQKVTLR